MKTRALSLLGAAAVLATLLVSGAATSASGQIPEKFTNLKIFPPDISQADLVASMRGMSGALGVRCDFCHARAEGQAHPDWASDAKEEKVAARIMLEMTRMLNAEQLPKLPERHEGVQITCRTCHRGQPVPYAIEDLLSNAYQKGGLDSLASKYESLRAKYHGYDTYNFGSSMLPDLAQRIGGHDKPTETARIAEYNLKWFPESGYTYYVLGQAHASAGDEEAGIRDLNKAITLDPELKGRVERALEEIKQKRGK